MSLDSLLDKTIKIQKLSTGSADGVGGYTGQSWGHWVSDIKARIQPLSGKERILYDQMNMRITDKIYIKPITNSDISPTYRILYGTRTYDIETIRDIDEQDRLITIECQETTNS